MIKKIKKILKNGNILSLSANLLGAGFSFFTFIILARELHEEYFGKWLLFITALGFMDMLRAGIVKSALIKYSTNKQHEHKAIGSAWVIGIAVTLILSLVILVIDLLFHKYIIESSWGLFIYWFPYIAFASLPLHFAMWYQQTKYNFLSLLVMRLLIVVPYFLFVAYEFFNAMDLNKLALVFILIHAVASVIVVLLGWTGIRNIFKFTRKQIVKHLHFGKYSLGTVIGSNLLKSSDVFIINALMGPAFVAFYHVPYKFIELIEVPVRSFGNTLFPKLAKAANHKKFYIVERFFNSYTGGLTIVLIPVYVVSFIFAEEFVYVLGGQSYVEYSNVFRIFIVYGLLLPIDRYSGIALDSIDMPKYNMIKVFAMVAFNVVVDIVAIKVFDSIYAVAIVTIGTVIVGVKVGIMFLNKKISISIKEIFKQGYEVIVEIIKKRKLPSIYN